jgi:hypothetical protein
VPCPTDSPCVAANTNSRDKIPIKCFNYDEITGEKVRDCKPGCPYVHRYLCNSCFFLTKPSGSRILRTQGGTQHQGELSSWFHGLPPWFFLQSTKDSEACKVQTGGIKLIYDIDHGNRRRMDHKMALVKILDSIAMETGPGMTEDPTMQKEIRIMDGHPTLGRTRALRPMLGIHQLM